MPTPNFTHDNTPPVAVTRADQTPDNGAPAGVPRASQAGDNTPPGNVTVSTPAHNDGAPVGIARPSQVPDNTAPGNVAVSTPAHADGAPVGIARADQTPNNAAPGNVAVSTTAHDNTAPTGIARADQTPNDGAPGGVPLASMTSTSDTPRAIGYTPPLSPLIDENVNTPIISIEGALVLNQVFGQTRIPNASALERVQLSLQDIPTGGPATITLVDAAGVSYGVSVTVADGESFGEYVLPTPLALLAGSNVRAKATAVPNGNPGGFGVVTLFTRLAA